MVIHHSGDSDYTLERDGRELQPERRYYNGYGIIPLREMEGNYNRPAEYNFAPVIIPLREMEGNYNRYDRTNINEGYYTLERDGRELQQVAESATAAGALYP